MKMKCTNPKLLHVKHEHGTVYRVYVPCGHCYACQCNSRAEWALRCKAELKVNKFAFFVTLTYDNENLPHSISHNQFIHKINIENLKPIHQRKWDFALLNKEHASNFLKELQKYSKTYTGSLCRYYLTGEYGDLTNRPHYHICLFFKYPIKKVDLEKILAQCWTYGNIDIAAGVNSAIINYVAKHQVKSCRGCKTQQKESPIFKKVSRYKGGIGYNLRHDTALRFRFFSDDEDKFIINVQNGVEYKVPFPRYLVRYWRPRKLHEYELSNLDSVSRENFEIMVYQTLLNHPQIFDPDFDKMAANAVQWNKRQDFRNRCKYEKQRIERKKAKIINSLNNKSLNYEHF